MYIRPGLQLPAIALWVSSVCSSLIWTEQGAQANKTVVYELVAQPCSLYTPKRQVLAVATAGLRAGTLKQPLCSCSAATLFGSHHPPPLPLQRHNSKTHHSVVMFSQTAAVHFCLHHGTSACSQAPAFSQLNMQNNAPTDACRHQVRF